MTTRKASLTTSYCNENNVINRWRVTSDTSGRTYTVVAVSMRGKIEYRCGCRGWTMHTPRRDCKHIRHVKSRCEL